MTTTTTATAKLTGIVKAQGACNRCDREIGRVFQVRHADGTEATYGRRCAAKVTGYSANAVERQAQIAARIAEVAHRKAIILAEFPGLDTAAEYVFGTAATEDAWWGTGRWVAFDTWQDYVRHYT